VRRLPGCGCTGCAGLLLVTGFVLAGAIGVLAGDHAALARPGVGTPMAAVAEIPSAALSAYRESGRRFGLDWPLLAGLGSVASDHGRRSDCILGGEEARGAMAMTAPAFAAGVGAAGLGPGADRCRLADAVPAAAAHLAALGAADNPRLALVAYPLSAEEVDAVLAAAASYGYALATVWPFDGPITQRFGPTDSVLQPPLWYRGTWYDHFHAGLDIGAPLGSEVVAMAAGVVTFAGRIADGAVVIEITHAPGVTSAYAHLATGLPVRRGQHVAAGDVLGRVGLTGISTGPHMHLAVWSGGEPLDPLSVLPSRIEPERAGGR